MSPSLLFLIWPALLLLVSFVIGRHVEQRHLSELQRREALRLPAVVAVARVRSPVEHCGLVTGSVVISHDHFKRFLAILRMLIGGRLGSYETLVARARREALLRAREAAAQLGATHVLNIKYETAAIHGRSGQASIGSLEVLVYATAVRLR